jgi:hypothetical protein
MALITLPFIVALSRIEELKTEYLLHAYTNTRTKRFAFRPTQTSR